MFSARPYNKAKCIIRRFFNKLKISKIIRVYTLYRNNKPNIILIKNIKNQVLIKHIDI